MTSLPRSALYKYIYCLYFIIALIGICLLYSARMSLFFGLTYILILLIQVIFDLQKHIQEYRVAHVELRIEQEPKYFSARLRARDHSQPLGLTYLHKNPLCCGAHCCCFLRQEFKGPLSLPWFDLFTKIFTLLWGTLLLLFSDRNSQDHSHFLGLTYT